MKRLVLPLFVFVMPLASAAGTARGATPLVASVSITTPAESLEARVARRHRTPHISPEASPSRAALLSIGATAVPVAAGAILIANTSHNAAGAIVMGSGVLLGPAVGYFDAGLSGRGATGLALRFGVSTLSLAGAMAGAATIHGGDIGDYAGPFILVMAGAAATTALAVVDCALIYHDVERARRASVSLAPVVLPGSGAPALGVSVRF